MPGNNTRRNFVGDVRPCAKCRASLVITEQMARWSRYVCSPCQVKRAVDWAARNRDKKRASNNAYHKQISGERAQQTARWRAAHPEKRAAHQSVQTALRRGDIERKACAVCGATKAHAHHDDYSRPLDVTWLCHTHHMERHAMLAARAKEPGQ